MCLVVLATDRATEPSTVDVRVTCAGGAVEVTGPDGDRRGAGRADRVPVVQLDALARQLAPLRSTPDTAPDTPPETTVALRGLLGVDDETRYDVGARWRPRPLPDFLTVPFGAGGEGRPVVLDIKETALGGMGPHGLCVGATGSGKSEVLRTIVLGLAMTHPPERLALVLVDYKGGATFAGLDGHAAHAAMISNLSDDLGLVDRLHDALFGEMHRRQQILLEAGNLPDTTTYNRRRDAGEPLAPLPNLLVVIDEFGELLTAKPEFIELVPGHRPDRPVDRGPPAARLAAAGGGQAARAGDVPVLPARVADVHRAGVPVGARRRRRVHAPAAAGLRLPQGGHHAVHAVQGRVRVRAVPAGDRGGARRRRAGRDPVPAVEPASARRWPARTGRCRPRTPMHRPHWTSWSPGSGRTAPARTRSGCRRSRARCRWTR